MRSLPLSLLAAALVSTTANAGAATCPVANSVSHDVCETAQPLGIDPSNLTVEGNTQFATNTYDVGHDNDCTGARSAGPDVIYRIDMSPGCIMTATLDLCDLADWWDQSLYFVTDCQDLLGNCRGSKDRPCENFKCVPEIAVFENVTPQMQTVYLVVDGKTPSAGGAFSLTVRSECVVPVEATTWGAIKASYGTD